MDWIWLQQCGVSTSITTPIKCWLLLLKMVLFHLSPAYGGRATDVHIVRDSGFLDLVEPYDEIMAYRGFKIMEDLVMMKMATLCIPPSKAKSMQMLLSDVRKTSNIANVRIYVEQAIGRMKVFHILKNELSII